MCLAAWQQDPVAYDGCPAALLGTTHLVVMRLQVRTEAEARVQQLRTAQDEEQQLTAQEKRKVGPCQPA